MKRIIAAFKEKWPYYSLELLVITFGILLAFGLNATYQNWNENRKQKQLEIETLKQIKAELITDSLAINKRVKQDYFDRTVYHFAFVEKNAISYDSMGHLLANSGGAEFFESVDYGYKSLTVNNTVSNNLLEANLTQYYEIDMLYLTKIMKYQSLHILQYYAPLMNDLLPREEDISHNDVDAVLQNRKFGKLLEEMMTIRDIIENQYMKLLKVCSDLIDQIDEEIARLEGQ